MNVIYINCAIECFNILLRTNLYVLGDFTSILSKWEPFPTHKSVFGPKIQDGRQKPRWPLNIFGTLDEKCR